jgi:hypothetical protein
MGIATKPSTNPRLADLNPIERHRKISVAEAARLNGVHESTFRRTYAHLIRRISKRRQVVELGDAINLPPKPE